jgi:hypothetical protein
MDKWYHLADSSELTTANKMEFLRIKISSEKSIESAKKFGKVVLASRDAENIAVVSDDIFTYWNIKLKQKSMNNFVVHLIAAVSSFLYVNLGSDMP